jgi:hypothetical protein
MDPLEALSSLRSQAECIPHPPAPHLKQRKRLEGTSILSLADTSPQFFLLAHTGYMGLHSMPPTPAYSSGVQFRAPVTPQSLPRPASQRNLNQSMEVPPSSSRVSHSDDPFESIEVSDSFPSYPDPELDGLETDSIFFRRRRTTDTYTKIHTLLASLRQDRISPLDILIQVLDPEDMAYDRYRANLYRNDSAKLPALIEKIMADDKGREKLLECMKPCLLDFSCEIVAQEMEQRRKKSILQGIQVVTPTFMERYNLDEEVDTSPFLTQILETAAQTDRAKLHNKKKEPEKVNYCYYLSFVSCFSQNTVQMCQVVTQQLLYQSSNRCLAFQAQFGLFLWASGASRQTIDALFRCGLSVCYDSVLRHVETVADSCWRLPSK